MEELFGREQKILSHAMSYLEEAKQSGSCSIEEYELMTLEYKRLLKQIQRITKIFDKTAVDFNTMNQDLMDKIHYDELTGIYNRRFLEESLERLVKTLANSGGKLSVLMIDVDFFKRYNDTYGHRKGDECLKEVVRAIKDSLLRQEDFVARYGGEEFVVVLPDTDEKGALVIAERILNKVRERRIPHEKNTASEYITVSVGATTGCVKYSDILEEYIGKADKALYLSKNKGRNCSTFLQYKGGGGNDV